MSSTLWHVKAEIRRFTDIQIVDLKELVEKEYNRRFQAEKTSAQAAKGG
jgi:hypothetical protein